MVEWALVLPGTLLIILAIVIIGTRYSDYMYITQSAHEIAFAMGGVPGLTSLTPNGTVWSSGLITANGTSSTVVTKETATACISCLAAHGVFDDDHGGSECDDEDRGKCSSDTSCQSYTRENCVKNVVTWYGKEFIRSKAMFWSDSDSPIKMETTFNRTGLVPMVSLQITATPTKWIMPTWIPDVGPSSVTSAVPYLVLK